MKIIKNTFYVLTLLALFDLLILFASLLQIGSGEGTGQWSGFWAWQAKQIISLLN